MTWTLIRKELRQHWLAFSFVVVAALFGYAMIVGATVISGQAGTPFDGLRLFALWMESLGALVLCHRLVVVEYQGRTQMFLEALPVPRWRMVAVKYALGLAVLLLLVALAFLFACLLAWRTEELTARFLAILATRAVSAIWCVYSFCFVMGLLGRYRFALYIAFFFGIVILNDLSDLRLDRFGPIALLDARFPYEGENFPWSALRETWELTLTFILLAAGLSLVREGSVASLLAEKMSHREKVFVAALLVGFVWAGSVLSEKKKKTPFDLRDAVTEKRQGITVKVASDSSDNNEDSRGLAKFVASELEAAREYLGMDNFPPVFITEREDLDANRYERGELKKSEGIHVQANFSGKEWNREHFHSWILRETLIEATSERAKLESKAWVLDGFALYWPTHSHADANFEQDKPLTLRALYGTRSGFTTNDLRCWLTFKERVGDEIAAGVAWSGIKCIARQAGPERCENFLRSVLGADRPKDFRSVLRERHESLEVILRRDIGEGLQPFFAQWQSDLARARATLQGDLDQLPRLHGTVTFVPLSSESRKARYHVTVEHLLTESSRYSFLHHLLPAMDEEVEPKSIQREQNQYPEQTEDELPETFSRGGRLYWTFALDVPALGCPVVSGWQRQEIK